MRTKSCWSDSFTLEIVYGWLLAALVATGLILLSECAVQPAHAGQWYLEGGIGAAFHQSTTDDGTWRQERVQPPNTRLMDQAWSIGLSYRINTKYSIQGHRFDWGSAAVKSRFGSDEDYYGGVCPNCVTSDFKVVDRMWGYDLTVSRYWPLTEQSEWYLKGGGAIAFHELKWTKPDSQEFGPTRVHGAIPMLVIGGGLCAGIICWDTTLYQGTLSMNGGCIGGGEYECGYPLSKQVGVSMLTIKIPLS